MNQGMRIAAGRKTTVPATMALTHVLAGACAPVTRCVAYANARVKSGEAATKTAADWTVGRSMASWFEIAMTSSSETTIVDVCNGM